MAKEKNLKLEPEKKAVITVTEELVIEARRGDQEALCSLCQAIVKSVMFRVMQHTDNDMYVEDITQEVLIRVCRHIKGLKHPITFNAWLGTIVINEVRRYMRKNYKHSNVLNIEDYLDREVEESVEYLPLDSAIRSEDREIIVEAVKSLPKRQKEAVMLHYYDGLNIVEAAKVMGIPYQNVSYYLILARKKVKRAYERHMSEPAQPIILSNP
jgi:RNA polymerase sigma-70 factor (ECF subfamily)